jgi:hypothetical protein
MTVGLGDGGPYGSDTLVEGDDQLSPIAGDPITFDFSDEPDGGLPGMWENYILSHDGAGAVSWGEEPAPDTYFSVAGGLALWSYTRTPPVPGAGNPFTEQGYAAGPRAVLEGRNARVSAIVRQPVALLDAGQDELTYSVTIALRLDPTTGSWVGARMRSVWQSGVWVTPLVLEVVQATGGDPVVLGSAAPAPTPDLLDIWETQPNAELIVELRGDTLVATLDDVVEASAQVPADGPPRVAFLVETAQQVGAAITPLPTVVAFQIQSLRDLERLGPPPAIPGSSHLEAFPFSDTMALPIRDMLDEGLLKQVTGRQFQFKQDTEVTVAEHLKFTFNAGEVIRLQEKLTTQVFIPCIRDLHVERSKRKGD